MCFLWLFTLFSSKFRFWPRCNTDWQDNGQLLNFRYKIQPKQRVHTFEPKPLPGDADLQNIRASQMGQLFIKDSQLPKLPANKHCAVTWDVCA